MKHNRLREMEAYILDNDFVSLKELCRIFSVSISTARRDVALLIKTGAFEKVYGGVGSVKPPSGVLRPFTEREFVRSAQKQYIGKLAARFVNDNDVIYIDSGTTTAAMTEHLQETRGVTVLTNNIRVLSMCIEYRNINTICFGGQLDIGLAAFGSNFCSIDNLRSFNIHKAFMAATGVSIERGATNSTPGELVIKRNIVEISKTSYLLVDSLKFGHSALITYADLDTFQCVITDQLPTENYQTYFKDNGICLVVD